MPEYFIAILGLRRILGVSSFKITKGDIAEALKVPKTMRAMYTSFLKGEVSGPKSDLQLKDLEWIKEALQGLDTTTLLPEMFPKLDAADIDLGVGEQILSIIQYLQEALPKNESLETGLITAAPPKASMSDDMRFLWVCRLVDNPLHLIHLMQVHQMTQRDNAVIIDTLPDLQTEMVNGLVESVMETLDTNTHIPRPQKMMMSILLEMPVINVKTLEAYKQSPTPEQTAPPPVDRAPNIAQTEELA